MACQYSRSCLGWLSLCVCSPLSKIDRLLRKINIHGNISDSAARAAPRRSPWREGVVFIVGIASINNAFTLMFRKQRIHRSTKRNTCIRFHGSTCISSTAAGQKQFRNRRSSCSSRMENIHSACSSHNSTRRKMRSSCGSHRSLRENMRSTCRYHSSLGSYYARKKSS